jgi:cutinase
MKTFVFLSTLLTLTAASPIPAAPKDPGKPPFNVLTGIGIGAGVSKNDVHDGVCKKYTYIFARGTTEAGNIGSRGFAGSTLLGQLQKLYPNDLAAQGVNYDAANFFSNFELGDRGGVNDMEWEANKAVFNCPKTTLILGGYRLVSWILHQTPTNKSIAKVPC